MGLFAVAYCISIGWVAKSKPGLTIGDGVLCFRVDPHHAHAPIKVFWAIQSKPYGTRVHTYVKVRMSMLFPAFNSLQSASESFIGSRESDLEGRLEVGNDVLDILDTDGYADKIRRNARRQLLRLCQL